MFKYIKMKNLLYLISFIALGFGVSSCESMLDRQPLSQIIDESADTNTVFTAADAESAIAAAYSGMKTSQAELFMLDYYVNGEPKGNFIVG